MHSPKMRITVGTRSVPTLKNFAPNTWDAFWSFFKPVQKELRAKGMRNRVTWTVTKWDPPHEVAMSGSGKGGTKYGVTLTVRPSKGGSTLGLRLELGGRPLFGPVGSAAARAVKGDVRKSLKLFVEKYG